MFIARSEYGKLKRHVPMDSPVLMSPHRSRHQVSPFFIDHLHPTDKPPSTFSPEGRLFQVEYSLEAIKLGSTAIGVATSHGILLGVEKRVTSPLLVSSSIEKIVEIDRHIGCAMSGLQADARSMIEHARVESQNHAFNYAEPLSVESLHAGDLRPGAALRRGRAG